MDFYDVNMVTLWAVMLVALFGMLRKDNVTVGKEGAFNPFRNLTREDFVRDGQLKVPWVRIKSAKTIQFFEREHRVPLVETGGTLCPVTAIANCFKATPQGPQSPAFVWRKERGAVVPLTHATFVKNVKVLIWKAGMEPSKFSGHNFCRGGPQWPLSWGWTTP
ncbi:hypothetical protein CYMTET_35880 [Cymbomonas tetramitiformis]|uniref:Uncharacterized protein n=1 Tax=Cymbomonas tetramitiformis TaxID=36881 RepID=A0AAE0F8B8_9CHLO|nr:hypothetical protein CYMTET_35880 [Cymbomonas tetramitiformis]